MAAADTLGRERRPPGFEQVIGQSVAIRQTIALAAKVALSDATVLLLGETGTGKELFARAMHASSTRADRSFVALNCSTFSKELMESEVFGHRAGAFTGAMRDKKGLIEEADGGSLFLDEIGEMQMGLQAKLLRVLETGEFFKVGSNVSDRTDVRIISATNRDLKEEVSQGRFREDLFYRLNVFTLQLPPLRERKGDILLIAEHFLGVFAEKLGKDITGMTQAFADVLCRQMWRGNIRELKNVIERAIILTEGKVLDVDSLPVQMQAESPQLQPLTLFDLASVEKMHIQRVLKYTDGNKVEAARLLNIGLTTVYRKIEEYGLQ